MRISDIVYNPLIKISDVLPPKLQMLNLGRIVVLAGPNGVGKTRLLHRISSAHSLPKYEVWPPPVLNGALYDPPPMTNLADHTPDMMVQPSSPGYGEVPLATLGLTITGWPAHAQFAQVGLFYPTNISEQDFGGRIERGISLSPNERLKSGREFWESPGGPTNILQVYREINYLYQAASEERSETKRLKICKKLNHFEKVMEALLPGRCIIYSGGNRGALIGIREDKESFAPLNKAGLSEGEKHFLGYAISMVQRDYLHEDGILCLDEPEHHLHPSAYLRVVDHLIDQIGPQGQIWIATHSVALVAHLLARYKNEVLLYFMDKAASESGAEPKQGGRIPSLTIESLMGGPDNINALREILDLPVAWHMVDLAAGLFINAGVVSVGKTDDPQAALAAEFVREIREYYLNGSKPLKVLDFGAGGGRLLRCWRSSEAYEAIKNIDYIGYDVTADHKDELENALAAFYGNERGDAGGQVETRILIHKQALKDHLKHAIGLDLFRCVLMINVLHEIDPGEWFGEFKLLAKALENDGSLVIIEDYQMPTAEMNHEWGFLLLERGPLAALFGIPEEQLKFEYSREPKYAGRIGMAIIPAARVAAVSPRTVMAALKAGLECYRSRVENLSATFARAKAEGFQREDKDRLARNFALAILQKSNFERAYEAMELRALKLDPADATSADDRLQVVP
jgi:hypothetical protein